MQDTSTVIERASSSGSLQNVRAPPKVSDLATVRRKKAGSHAAAAAAASLPKQREEQPSVRAVRAITHGINHEHLQDDSMEALLARLHDAALQLDTAKHSQATADAAIEAALQALQAKHSDGDITVQQSALHVLTLAARDPTNAHELGSLLVVSCVVPLLQHTRHTLRHAACQFLDVLVATAASTPAYSNVDEADGASQSQDTATLQVIWDCGALPVLLRMLCKSAATSATAASCLGCCQRAAVLLCHLAARHKGARDQIIAGGGVDGLLRTLEFGGARPAAQHAATRLLHDLATSHAPLLMASHPRTATLLTTTLMAKGSAPELQCSAAAALKQLCSQAPAQHAVLGEAGSLAAIARMCSSHDPAMQVAGSRLLARLAPQVDLVAVVNTGALQALCARGLTPSSGARVMGHTPRSAAILSVCQLLLPTLEKGVGAEPEDEAHHKADGDTPQVDAQDGGDAAALDEERQDKAKELSNDAPPHKRGGRATWGLALVRKDRKQAVHEGKRDTVDDNKDAGAEQHAGVGCEEGGSKGGEAGCSAGATAKVAVAPAAAASLLRVQGLLPLLQMLLGKSWEPYNSMAATLLAGLAVASSKAAAAVASPPGMLPSLLPLLASDNPQAVLAAARAATAMATTAGEAIARGLLDDEARVHAVAVSVQAAAAAHIADEFAHNLLMALLTLLDTVSDAASGLTPARAWRLGSQGPLLRACGDLLSGSDPVAAQAAARLLYNIVAHRPSAVELAAMPVVLGGLLGLASAVLEPPPKGGPPDLAAAVQGASHTALCAVACMASYALPSINTALLSGGVVPLLAGLLGAPHVGIVLRRASLVTLIDLCQGVEEDPEEGSLEGPWGAGPQEDPVLAGSDDMLLTVAREQLLVMHGMAALDALVQDDPEVSGETGRALVALLESTTVGGRKALVDHKYASMVRKHFHRNGRSIKA